MPNKRILIIDDDPTILNSMKYMLKDNYTVSAVLGGQEAMDLLAIENGQFDLIISDLSMPELNGASFYLSVSEKYSGLEDRIIFMTGGALGGFIEAFGINTKNPCLTKPFTNEELHQAIENFFKSL